MSNNAWNSEYNSAKGALLVGDGTKPIVTVTGLAATNYHWVAYIEHHKVIDNN